MVWPSTSADESVIVGRTTSRDAGVDANADLIVATAALEVIQRSRRWCGLRHKDLGPAAFVQRSAGRTRGPWTIVVLSDYRRPAAYRVTTCC